MRRFATPAAVVAAVLIAIAGIAMIPTGTPPSPLTAADTGVIVHPLVLGACNDPTLTAAGAKCGMLTVPLDYSDPTGPTVQIAVSEVTHTSPADQYQGAILVNPGGPGGSGLEFATLGQAVPNHVGDDYDWIGFDPRGVGSSQPALTCVPNYFGPDRPNYVPTSAQVQQEWLTRAQQYAQACGQKNLALLQHMTTVDSAFDMDSIRVALGLNQISYYGFSYGTYLGQVYSTLFPSHLRRLVLDSNVDPSTVWYQANLNQDKPFQRNADTWFAWVAKYDTVFHLGTTGAQVAARYYSDLQQLQAHPAGGVVGPDELTDAVTAVVYSPLEWQPLAAAWSAWAINGDASQLVTLYQEADDPGSDNQFAGYSATECSDQAWPTNWHTWQVDNWRLNTTAPFSTWGNAWFNAQCAFWPVAPSTPVTVNGRGVASALLIDQTLDAATPYEGSLAVRGLFPTARLLAVQGGTAHAASLSGDACVDDRIADYLLTGALPARQPGNRADVTCAPPADPIPTTSSNATNAPSAQAAPKGNPLNNPTYRLRELLPA